MNDDRKITFKLKGKRPEDFTLERLAQYISVLGRLTGAPDQVRLGRIAAGSVCCQLMVKEDHYPKLVNRLASTSDIASAPDGLKKAVEEMRFMIGEDNVTAEVRASNTRIFSLRPDERPPGVLLGPMVQRYTIRGRIVGLEGKGSTKHARILEHGANKQISGEFRDESIATELKHHLWRDVVELTGTAKLIRHPDGAWELKEFRIDRVESLDASTASDVFGSLRNTLGDRVDDLSDIQKLRN